MSGKIVLTHIAAMVVGWACVGHIIGSRDSKQEAVASSVKTKSGGRSPGSKQNPGESGPLARWMGISPDPVIVERLKHEPVAEVADALIKKWGIESPMQTILLQHSRDSTSLVSMSAELRDLLLAEPKGMLVWFEGLSFEKKQSLELLLKDEKLASAISGDQLDAWEKMGVQIRWIFLERGRRAGKAGDMAYLESILKPPLGAASNFEPDAAWDEVIANWPVDRLDQLLQRLKTEVMVRGGGFDLLCQRLPLNQRQAFLDALSNVGHFRSNPIELESLRRSVAAQGVGMDLNERLRITMQMFGGDAEKAAPYLMGNDIDRLFSGEGLLESDSLQASLQKVRKGEMKAEELLGEVASRLGKLADGHGNLVREKVFQRIAKIAPDAAVTLMVGIPAKTVQDKALALGVDPAGFEAAACILRAREPEVPNDLHNRFSGWGHKSFEGLARYGDAYVSWAMAMPPSLERDLVLSAIAIHVEKEDPDWAARLRAQKTYQSGWRPGMK